MENLLNNLKKLLQKDERLVNKGEILKNKVIELALKLDKGLIKLLLSDEKMKEVFFADVNGVLIFDKDKFVKFVSNKQFLPDSYTAFKNKIGLIDEKGEFIRPNNFQKGEIVIYKTPKNEVEVRFEKETVWLRQDEIARLYGKERSVITKHINYF